MDIEAVIAEATTPVANVQEAPKVEATEQTSETPAEAKPEPAEDLATKPDSELTPEQLAKREENRQSHRNSREAKLRREVRELREYRAKMEQQASAPQQTKPVDDGSPKEDEYDNFLDYVKATARWEAKQEFTEQNKVAPSIDPVKVERIQQIAQQEQEFAQRTPEYRALYEKHSDFLGNMPKPVAEALLEADNATLAIYALMKEGTLEDLEDLSPSRMAMEIGRAEERGKGYLGFVRKTTNASAPIESLKGTGSSSKPLASKSVEELMKQFAT